MSEEDIISQAASVTSSMIPDRREPLTSMAPQPLQMPPQLPRMAINSPVFGQAGNEFQTVSGRKRADRQALIGNTVNLIKSGADYIQAKKQRDLTMTFERLFSAQEGLQEAQASGDQEAIKRNSAIINDITSDPKRVKLLQKALNIDLVGNGKNKNENMALQEAWKNYNTERQKNPNTLNPVAQRLMQSQPIRQQLSPEAQAQAMAIKAGLIPKAGEILRANQENFKAILSAKTSEERNTALENAAKLRAQAEIYHADKVFDAANTKALGQQNAQEIRARVEKYKADLVAKTWDKRLVKMDEWAKMKTGDSPIFKKLLGEAKTYNDRLKELSTENTKLQGELDKKGTSIFGIKFGAASNADVKQMRNKILLNNLEMQQVQSDLNGVTKKMQLMDTMGVINIKELSAGSSNGGDNSDNTEENDEPIDTGE